MSRTTLTELEHTFRLATECAEIASELAVRLESNRYVKVAWTNHENREICLVGGEATCRAVTIAALEEVCLRAREHLRTLNAHKIKHTIKLPNLRELRKKHGGAR